MREVVNFARYPEDSHCFETDFCRLHDACRSRNASLLSRRGIEGSNPPPSSGESHKTDHHDRASNPRAHQMPDYGAISPGLYSCAIAVLQGTLIDDVPNGVQPSRVPPAARSRSARLRSIALRLSSTWASLWVMLADAVMHLLCDAARASGLSVAGFGVASRAPRISSTIRGGSARLALLRLGSLISQPSAPGAVADDV